MPPVIYLIDGHALAYRTYFAITAGSSSRFSTSSGEPTAGVFGFASSLFRILEQDQPQYLAVAFDTGKTFRNDRYPEYKATRAKMPEDLRPQIERIKQMIDAFHFPRLEKEGFEADDILGSIALQAVEQGFGVKIITGDRDLLQLVDERIIVNLPGKTLAEAQDYQIKDVLSSLGVRPGQVVDYKALVGDKSDNIPGVAGIGEKTAVSLYQTYANLDEIYAHLEDLSPRIRSLLEKGQQSAYLSKELATIRKDVPIILELEKARTDQADLAALENLFKQLEFRTLMKKLPMLNAWTKPERAQGQIPLFNQPISRLGVSGTPELKVHVIQNSQQLRDLQEKLQAADEISFDTETTSTDPMRADVVGISLAVQPGEAFYIPVGHRTSTQQLKVRTVMDALRPFLSDPNKRLTGHNLKYDGLVLTRSGLKPAVYFFDTMIAEWLIDPASRHLGLKDMAEHYLGETMTHIEELIGSGKKQLNMADVPVEKVAPYAAADAAIPLRLEQVLLERLKKQNAFKLFNEMEMPLIPVLANMEETGITLDVNFLRDMSVVLSQRIGEIEQNVYDAVGYPFNLNSTQQLSKVLFETLKLRTPGQAGKTSSGHFSTSASVLDDLSGEHPVVDMVLEYRELTKLKSTYIDSLPMQINPLTGRVHTSFNQTGSVTGRLASSNPNLQNIPIRTEIGQRVRKGFTACEGMLLLSVDYSQIELRIVAHMACDETMLDAFRHGQDIHATTAAAIHDISIDKVTKEQRRHAKTINFGLIYGMSPFGLSRATGLTLAEAENFVKAYFDEFPGVKKYLDEMRRVAAEQGYVETLLGRKRYFPNLRSSGNIIQVRREEREAINAPIQGTAADIIKLAMIHLPAELKRSKLQAQLLLQVHDELILECPPDELELTAQVVRATMENAYSLSIPLLTEARSGKNWGEMQTIAG